MLTSDWPYRKAHTRAAALGVLMQESGTHLYQPAVRALLRILKEQDGGLDATDNAAAA